MSPSSPILTRLCHFLEPHLGRTLSPSETFTSLTDLGVDSFMLMELVLFAEREYRVKLPLARVGECSSLKELGRIISESLTPISDDKR